MSTLLASQEATLWLAVFIAAALFACLLIPLLRGGAARKIDLGPRFPIGAGDVHPGYRGNPTPETCSASASTSHDAVAQIVSPRSYRAIDCSGFGNRPMGLFNHEVVLGAMSLRAIVLIAYGRYFVRQGKELGVAGQHLP